jgi:hypothetical protein
MMNRFDSKIKIKYNAIIEIIEMVRERTDLMLRDYVF